eukprot:scaffold228260_cov19-Prasinocladus_malaysianus.AAC.1
MNICFLKRSMENDVENLYSPYYIQQSVQLLCRNMHVPGSIKGPQAVDIKLSLLDKELNYASRPCKNKSPGKDDISASLSTSTSPHQIESLTLKHFDQANDW